ncbi:MAG TPA: SUMF1/EgtB/PvdO family nonheme iron enzyme [Kofleriaceae bacterium]|nr:SUMF1/EgtB/PvdO family nonheme iron enzyme [Kofleriaceae bacterium]
MLARSSWIVAGAGGLALAGLATVALAAPPAGYRCGKGGKPNPKAQACTCPAGKKADRNADDLAVCVAAKSTHAATPGDGGFAPPIPEPTCPSDMVPVHRGTFDMGSTPAAGDPDEIPAPKGKRTVTISGFCLDRTEVTVDAYAQCVAAGGCTAAATTVDWEGLDPATAKKWNDAGVCNAGHADRKAHPINCVTWDQATAYCAAQHKRLPTEAEWEYAARGTDGRSYPWEPKLGAPSPRLVNGCDKDCQALGKSLGFKWKSIGDSDQFATTAPVGSFSDGSSPFGAYDMGGNVWEWVADEYARYDAGTFTDPAPAETARAAADKLFVLRGGGWDSDDRAYFRAANRLHTKRSARSSSNGFRCARAGS